MTDELWNQLLKEAIATKYNIVMAGRMATKSKVEDHLMRAFGVDRNDAHSAMNHIEYAMLDTRHIDYGNTGRKTVWISKEWPEPVVLMPEIYQLPVREVC